MWHAVSECLFHRFERNTHPDAGNPVPKRHRGRSPGHSERRHRWRQERPCGRQNRTGVAQVEGGRSGEGRRRRRGCQRDGDQREGPSRVGSEGLPGKVGLDVEGDGSIQQVEWTGQTAGIHERIEWQEGRRQRGSGQRTHDRKTPEATGATDLGALTRMAGVRGQSRSIRAPRRSVRERLGSRWSGWKPVANHYRRPKRSSSIFSAWPKTTLSSWCSANPSPDCSAGSGGRPGFRPGCVPSAPPPKRGRRPKSDKRRGRGIGRNGGTRKNESTGSWALRRTRRGEGSKPSGVGAGTADVPSGPTVDGDVASTSTSNGQRPTASSRSSRRRRAGRRWRRQETTVAASSNVAGKRVTGREPGESETRWKSH